MTGTALYPERTAMPDGTAFDGFRPPQVAKWAGLSYRQLDYWIETDRIFCNKKRPGTGNARLIARSEIPIIRTVSLLLAVGLPLQTCFDIARCGTGFHSFGNGVVLMYPKAQDAA